MAGSDKRRGHYVNKRSDFLVNKEYIQLERMIFPWIEIVEEKLLDSDITISEF